MSKKKNYIDKNTGEKLTKEIINNYGDIWYYNNKNQQHRTDGPAAEYSNGSKYWYQNGKRHKTDGPAIEYPDGTKEWYVDGKEYTELEFNIHLRKLKMENL